MDKSRLVIKQESNLDLYKSRYKPLEKEAEIDFTKEDNEIYESFTEIIDDNNNEGEQENSKLQESIIKYIDDNDINIYSDNNKHENLLTPDDVDIYKDDKYKNKDPLYLKTSTTFNNIKNNNIKGILYSIEEEMSDDIDSKKGTPCNTINRFNQSPEILTEFDISNEEGYTSPYERIRPLEELYSGIEHTSYDEIRPFKESNQLDSLIQERKNIKERFNTIGKKINNTGNEFNDLEKKVNKMYYRMLKIKNKKPNVIKTNANPYATQPLRPSSHINTKPIFITTKANPYATQPLRHSISYIKTKQIDQDISSTGGTASLYNTCSNKGIFSTGLTTNTLEARSYNNRKKLTDKDIVKQASKVFSR
ncbi:hypothetical protein [Candidatus Deianiraea vastatrix]|uniref:Uncharacterized protein n=1 Tax=Candidatus Deianiraea vastatrix TaxID=2163644 RepID=A0A5B8XD83_9RICK|nr:hypothetical protein [Candidatus Deianiraea vastatrix]QED23243.1 hypothetical protein Deia_00443 [Candidatus Deianiraea vastatrix]